MNSIPNDDVFSASQEGFWLDLPKTHSQHAATKVPESSKDNTQGAIYVVREETELWELEGRDSPLNRAVERHYFPISVLDKLLSAPDEFSRVITITNAASPFRLFYDAVMENKYAIKKTGFSSESVDSFTKSPKIAISFEVFETLWNKSKSNRVQLISTLNGFMIRNRSFELDPKFREFFIKNIREQSNVFRIAYASSSFCSDPDVLELLKDDSHRPVVTRIAHNSSAYSHTHKYLLENYKSSSIKDAISRFSMDNGILNYIYHNTKSALILKQIEGNPSFMKI